MKKISKKSTGADFSCVAPLDIQIVLPSGTIILHSLNYNEKTDKIDVDFSCVSGTEKILKKEFEAHFIKFLNGQFGAKKYKNEKPKKRK